MSCSNEQYVWTLRLYRVMILPQRYILFVGGGEHGIDANSLRRLWWQERRVVSLHPAAHYHKVPRPTFPGTKRPRCEGSQGSTAAFSPLGTSAQQAVRTPGACQATCPCRVPPPWRAPPPAGGGQGGTRNRRTSPSVQTGSVSPTARAGVRGCPGWAEPVPLVGRGAARGTRKRACGR